MSKTPFKSSDAIIKIHSWNSTFPFDYIFRQKYNIPFGSKTHLEMSFFDMKFDIAEEKFMDYIRSRNKFAKEYKGQLLKDKTVNVEVRKELEKQEFEDLDLSQFDNM